MIQENKIREKYKIFVDDDNIIHIVEQTNATYESSLAMKEEVVDFIKKTGSSLLLIDLKDVATPPSDVRKNIVEMFKNTDIKKIAVFGPSVAIRVVAKFIFNAAGMKDRRFFATQKEALEWLKS